MRTNEWFTESLENCGVSFGLKIKSQLHHERSSLQVLDIYETTDFGRLMVIDGSIMLTTRDNFLYHEMITHPVLFSHPDPKQVVIIGGGDCGTLQEALKHPVKQVKQIEIDERVTRLSEIYFPELCQANHDPRAELLFLDGIKWMQEAPNNSVDIIIVDCTDPVGPAVGLFNQAFYEQCYRVLSPHGILVQQSESPLLHQNLIKEIRQAMRKADFSDLATLVFPQPVYPSGWWSVTLAAKQPQLKNFRRDLSLLQKLQTKYYHFALHEVGLTPLPFLEKTFV